MLLPTISFLATISVTPGAGVSRYYMLDFDMSSVQHLPVASQQRILIRIEELSKPPNPFALMQNVSLEVQRVWLVYAIIAAGIYTLLRQAALTN